MLVTHLAAADFEFCVAKEQESVESDVHTLG